MGQQLIKSDCVVIMGLGGSCTIVQDVTGAGARAASPNNGLWEMCGENVLTLLQFVLNWGLFWTGMFVSCFPFCYANNTVFTSKCFPPTFLQLILMHYLDFTYFRRYISRLQPSAAPTVQLMFVMLLSSPSLMHTLPMPLCQKYVSPSKQIQTNSQSKKHTDVTRTLSQELLYKTQIINKN